MTEASAGTTWMRREALETPAVLVAQQAQWSRLHAFASSLRVTPPSLVATCARGSSDHAATYAKYMIETRLGIPVTSVSPSVSSVYGQQLQLAQALFIAISQSGRSPDLLAATERARDSGARVLAIVNDADSPLAALAEVVFPIAAGHERSVAATKSCIGAMALLHALVAAWKDDVAMHDALAALPAQLRVAVQGGDEHLLDALRDWSGSLFVIGRGTALAAAQEMALKLKETCGLHAEAYSAAEVRHGPMAIVGRGFPVLAVIQPDATAIATREVCDEFAARGARVLRYDVAGECRLPMPADPVLTPLLALQTFYPACEALAKARGFDPDAPPYLRKVTQTQ